MKRPPVILAVALAACAQGNSGPLFGGFTPASGAAVILPSANCTNISAIGPTALSGILIELASGADACNVLTKANACGTGANSTVILAGALNGAVGASTVGAAGPGNYPYLVNPPTGSFKAVTTSAAKVDGTCTAAADGRAQMVSGSVSISAVSASNVSGTMDLHFDNGQVYAQPFTVAVCPVSIDTCALFNPCSSHACVQP